MKKNAIITFMFLLFMSTCFAQSLTTTFSKSYKSNFCGEESFSFTFETDCIKRTDNFYTKTERFYSRMTTGEFTEEGLYLETWTPGFFLEENGSDDYYLIKKNWYRIFYDKKGGNLLCILEFQQVDNKLDVDNGKYYLTDLGKKIFCTN